MTKPLNWTEIIQTCPEFVPNAWDVILATVAIIGSVLNMILFLRFQKQRKEGSSFLSFLSFCDLVMCLMYLWRYSATSLIMGLQLDSLAQFHLDFRVQMEYIMKMYEPMMALVMLYIIVERFLWTCSSRTRLTWKVFTVKMPKFILLVVTAVFIIVAVIFTPVYDKPFSSVPFCDIVFPLLTIEDSIFEFVKKLLFSILALTSLLTLLFALLTAFRLKHVGKGNEPVNQEEVNLESQAEQKANPSTDVIKRSIICMLSVYIMFFIRAIVYYLFIENMTSDFYSLNLHSRILTLWRYDFLNVVFAASRFLVYYAVCKNQMVIENPPLGQ